MRARSGIPYGLLRVPRSALRALPALLLVGAAVPLDAQWQFNAGIGVRYGSALVEDVIVNPITLKTGIGFAAAAGVASPAQNGWSGEATVDINGTGLVRDELGQTHDVGGVATLAFAVAVRRDFTPRLSARAGLGGIAYFPESDAGVFSQGSGGVRPLGVAAARYRLWRQGSALNSVELRYDVHRFLTPALRAAGFQDGRLVHRLMLGVTVEFGAGKTL